MKITKYTLDNGLKLILCSDNTKHCTIANLFVRFGGNNKNIIINGKEKKIKNGMAHFIEHLLIEHSIYGNSLLEFNKKHTHSNGFTSDVRTEYYINSVSDFEEDLIRLINIVNNSKFTREDIENTRGAIIKERMMDEDNKFKALYKLDYECLFNKIEYPNILGEIDDIKSISYEDIKECYDTFYSPNNQILVISGKFNLKRIKKIVEETYKKIDKKTVDYSIIKPKENNEVNIKEKEIKKDTYMDYVRINYKINIENLNNFEQIKLGYYLDYYLSYLFDGSSNAYSELVKKKICIYNIDYGFNKIDNFYIITIGTYTNNHKEFIEKIKKEMKQKKVDLEDFNLKKKESIIEIILREDNLFNMIKPYFDNIIKYNYFNLDCIEDIETQSFDEYKKMINDLNLENFVITKMIKNN